MDREKKVYVPKNVKKRLEFFRGFGVNELIITVTVGIIAIVPTIFLYKFTNQAFAMSIFLITIATTVTLVMKDNNDVSFIKKLRLVLKHILSQKKFNYTRRK